MQRRVEKAGALMGKYNCCQSILAAYGDLIGLDEDTALRIGEGFGSRGGRHEVCGVVSGIAIVLGMRLTQECDEAIGETGLNAGVRDLVERFREKNGSIICRELLRLRKAGKAPRSCKELVKEGARILESEIAIQKTG